MFRTLRLPLLAAVVAVVLAACGGGDDITDGQNPRISQSTPGTTPFVQFLQLSDLDPAQVARITVTVAPRPGTASRPVSATYVRDYLARRGWLAQAPTPVTVPVVGLYADHANTVTLTVVYADDSSDTLVTQVTTAAFTDPTGLLARPRVLKARAAGTDLGFDFVMMKPANVPPIVVDTDGHIRWSGGASGPGRWAAFTDNGIIAGENNSTRFRRYELDGSTTDGQLAGSPTYTQFHHNIDKGPNGLLLGEVDARVDGVDNIESIVVEFNAAGVVTREWDIAKIVADHMRANGDDPSALVRAGVDWFHNNSVAYDPRDHSLIVSGREVFVIKVDYETKAIKWILGDPTKYWHSFASLRAKALTLPAGELYPIGQHALSIHSDGQLLLFNNGGASFNQPSGAPVGEARSYSAVSAYTFDAAAGTAREAWNFDYGKAILSDVCSSVYEGRNKSLMVVYSAADNRTKLRLVGLTAAREVALDLEYDSPPCAASWNSEPVPFDDLRYTR